MCITASQSPRRVVQRDYRPRIATPRPLTRLAVLLAALSAMAGVAAASIVPATGSYAAGGAGAPPAYSVRATVKRESGRTTISVRVGDRCGGFASFPRLRVARNERGVPIFSAQVGGARVGGHWVGATRIEGSVKTPCTGAQRFVLRLAA